MTRKKLTCKPITEIREKKDSCRDVTGTLRTMSMKQTVLNSGMRGFFRPFRVTGGGRTFQKLLIKPENPLKMQKIKFQTILLTSTKW